MTAYMYETMYILRPDLNDEAIDATIGKYQTMLKDQGASILETQHRGKRRLAYEINRHREGIYIQMNYTGPGGAIVPLERAMRLSEEVIRFLTVKQESDEPLPEAVEEPAEAVAAVAADEVTVATGEEE
ncbi:MULTISPECIES: 30S ribosomal protein S6 [Cyanophyceae]|uniref:Small ribosomal subunit protein bS6 n=1 Tax=Leptolyngbya subtilissima DQ-A4 TaxID=2933933 RepID=A0ABV0K861_9CYAN|nr:30S ribosomal protein S6 [Nodosilinea sp. FACHB-141]MBD2110502.1 30S ribosomal protein S6 [Nodosilinea sp. FACHB-141]